jgi:hypothetical protein
MEVFLRCDALIVNDGLDASLVLNVFPFNDLANDVSQIKFGEDIAPVLLKL